MRFCAFILAALLAAAPARAAILDIQAEESGDRVRILFVFDAQPAGASITASGAEVQATVAGASGPGRVLRPSGGALRQISVAERPLGLAIGAVAARPVLSAEASVFRDSVLFELLLTPGPDAPSGASGLGGGGGMGGAAAGAGAPEGGGGGAGFASDDPAAQAPGPGGEPGAPGARILDAGALDMNGLGVGDAAAELQAALAADPDAAADAAAGQEAQAAGQDATPEAAETAEGVAGRGDPDWAAGGDNGAAPLRQGPGGSAAQLLAARLDPVSCRTAGETVRADPWALDALYDHGACLARDGQQARAWEVFQRLVAFDPASAPALAALGVLRQEAGDEDGARAYYDRAMAVGPEDGLAILIGMLLDMM